VNEARFRAECQSDVAAMVDKIWQNAVLQGKSSEAASADLHQVAFCMVAKRWCAQQGVT